MHQLIKSVRTPYDTKLSHQGQKTAPRGITHLKLGWPAHILIFIVFVSALSIKPRRAHHHTATRRSAAWFSFAVCGALRGSENSVDGPSFGSRKYLGFRTV